MFITWQRAVGGQMKSDLSFSKEVVWNNLPLPEVSEEQRTKVIAAGRKVLAAREAIEERAGEPVSLADMYASLATMDPALRAAHDELDSAVDVAFGATRRCSSDAKRLEILLNVTRSWQRLRKRPSRLRSRALAGEPLSRITY